MARGDAELAAVMRKLLEDDGAWISIDRQVVRYRLAFDGFATLTEEEMAAVQEVLDARR